MKVFLVGGFLGSGKTTAIHQAVNYLKNSGKIAGVVTNDQGDQLVDTRFLQDENIAVKEVTGSCFCCNYNELDKCLKELNTEIKPDAVFAESVGSCTDLVATIIRPLVEFNGDGLQPVLSVFVDVRLLLMSLQNAAFFFKTSVNYIFKKQLEEADVLVVNKIDLVSEEDLKISKSIIESAYGNKTIIYLNALLPESIKNWIDTIFAYDRNLISTVPMEVDYDMYGEGEAELAWLDGEIGIETITQIAAQTSIDFINNIYARVQKDDYPIGHLKFLLGNEDWQKKISFTSVDNREVPLINDVPNTNKMIVLINARVQVEPQVLKQLVDDAITETELKNNCKITEGKWAGFKPGYPKPTYRLNN